MDQRFGLTLIIATRVLAMSPPMFAQLAGTGAFTKAVTDPSFALVARVAVTLTNHETEQVRTTTIGAHGFCLDCRRSQ